MIECCTNETDKKTVAQTGHIRKRREKSLRCSGAARPCAACTVPLARSKPLAGTSEKDCRKTPNDFTKRRRVLFCLLLNAVSQNLSCYAILTLRPCFGAPATSLFSLSGSVFAALPCAAFCGGFRPRTPAILLWAGTSCRSRAAHYNLRLDRRQGTFAA